jgi:hypothetical protein
MGLRIAPPTGTPKLTWQQALLVVDFGGPDFNHDPHPARVRRCPAYVVVDATSGRGWGAFQTCDPPYRG